MCALHVDMLNDMRAIALLGEFTGRKVINQTAVEPWLQKRREYVGGSDVCLTMGMAPEWMEKTAFDLAMEKREGTDSFEGNDATDLGKFCEDGILKMAKFRFRWQQVVKCGWLIQDSAEPRLGCTPDALLLTPFGPAVMQVKVTRSRLDAERRKGGKGTGEFYGWKHEGVPNYILLQVQAEMAVTGFQHAVVLAFHLFDMGMGNGERQALHAHYVPRNDELIGEIRASVRDFWTNYVEA